MKYFAFLFLVDFFLVEEGYGRSMQVSTMSFGTNSSYPSFTCNGYGGEDGDGEYDEDGDYYYYEDSQEGKLPDENALNKTLYGSHSNSSSNYGGYQTYNSSYGHKNSTGPQVVVISLQTNSSNPSGSIGSSARGGGNWNLMKHNLTEILKHLLGPGGSTNLFNRLGTQN